MLTPQEAHGERARRRAARGCPHLTAAVCTVCAEVEALREQVARLQAQVERLREALAAAIQGQGRPPSATEQLGLWEG